MSKNLEKVKKLKQQEEVNQGDVLMARRKAMEDFRKVNELADSEIFRSMRKRMEDEEDDEKRELLRKKMEIYSNTMK